ncbi:DUF262 domain-containing protein [Microbacterium sp.]|uniref:DUF262 domain-containing protein n=1 Tax=Microbacterium sp. TaxID=51671 RepID=UPI00273302C5|nr:DUF262 domain-containing protein [Microbacterium sp.]MDP3951733.1 DUF262 domain-containing protein [Microbacterium sp.]
MTIDSTPETRDDDANRGDESLEADVAAGWLDEPSLESGDLEVEVGDYDIVSSPNDWNFSTIVNFIESGAMKIPTFQRNYVWDKKRASKLIESLLIGLPVPQVFLYEESRNSFLVIDGQQRLLTLYFFTKGRFPRPKIRGELHGQLGEGLLDEGFLEDDHYFEPFKLALPKSPNGTANRFHGLTYKGLKEDKTSLDLRTIRNIVVKQTSPDGNSAVFEIFSRLNTGGVNLTPQEIRASLYHSELLSRVIDLNKNSGWRQIVGQVSPDARMRDTEFLLRSLALANGLDTFTGSMANFINAYCLTARKLTESEAAEEVDSLRQFIDLVGDRQSQTFMRAGKFSGVLFESFFAAWSRSGELSLSADQIAATVEEVKVSPEFAETLQEGSTKPVNIKQRVALAVGALETVD